MNLKPDEVKIMKSMNLKRLVLSTAIMGASSLAFAATADQATTNSYDVPQSESRAVTPSTPADHHGASRHRRQPWCR